MQITGKYYNIVGTAGAGYSTSMIWNKGESKWWQDFNHDGTGTTYETLQEAEADLSSAQDDDIRNIKIIEIEYDIEE